jgi:hypothetical protein
MKYLIVFVIVLINNFQYHQLVTGVVRPNPDAKRAINFVCTERANHQIFTNSTYTCIAKISTPVLNETNLYSALERRIGIVAPLTVVISNPHCGAAHCWYTQVKLQ